MSVEAALNGCGVMMGRKRLLRNYLRQGSLVCPFDDELAAGRGYELIMPRENLRRPGVQAFSEWVREVFDEDE